MLLHFVDDDSYGFFFPNPSDFEGHWRSATSSSGGRNLIRADLESVFDWVEVARAFGEDPREQIWDLVRDCNVYSPALLAAGAAAEWEEESGRVGYDNARSAIGLLDVAIENAMTRGWNSVSVFCFQQLADLVNDVGTVEESDLSRAVDILEGVTSGSDTHLGNLSTMIQIFVDNSRGFSTSKESGKQAFVVCVKEANKLHEEGSFFQERDVLEQTIELSSALEIDQRGLKRRYTETYSNNADFQSTRGASLEASEIARALQDDVVMATLSDEEKKEWKDRLRSAVKSAARELRHNGVSLDTPHHRKMHSQLVESLVGDFVRIKSGYSPEAALIWLLTNQNFVPEYDSETEDASIMEIISTVSYSESGHLINFDPTEIDVSSNYILNTSIANSALVSVLSTLIRQGEISEIDIYVLLNWLLDFDSDIHWYATRFITHIFERRDAEAIHIGVPRIESLLYSLLLKEGEDADALMDDGTGTRTLGSLLPRIEGYIPEDLRQYLRLMYNEPVGQLFGGNLRNRVAHGLIMPGENNTYNSLLVLADFLRILIHMNSTRVVKEYGLPAVVLVPIRPESRLAYISEGNIFPLAVGPKRKVDTPDEDEVIDYIKGVERTISTIADKFGVPYQLMLSQIRVLEALEIIELDPDNEQVRPYHESKSLEISSESRRGKIATALAADNWMNCNEVAECIGIDSSAISSTLSDMYRGGYVRRRKNQKSSRAKYEYKLKESVEIIE